MAMTTCKECKKEVSSTAKTCPQCGANKPGDRVWHGFAGMAVLGILGYGVYLYTGGTSDTTEIVQTKSDKACSQNDGECIFKQNWIDVSEPCRKLVKKSAKYDLEWTDGMFTPVFSHFNHLPDKQTMTFIGDQVKFTNAFNAKIPMTYRCTYDLKNKKVTGFDISEGRI